MELIHSKSWSSLPLSIVTVNCYITGWIKKCDVEKSVSHYLFWTLLKINQKVPLKTFSRFGSLWEFRNLVQMQPLSNHRYVLYCMWWWMAMKMFEESCFLPSISASPVCPVFFSFPFRILDVCNSFGSWLSFLPLGFFVFYFFTIWISILSFYFNVIVGFFVNVSPCVVHVCLGLSSSWQPSLPAEGKHKRSYNASLPVALHLAPFFLWLPSSFVSFWVNTL